MADITELPDNFIGKDDRERLESFGGHTIARGRATRWHWAKDAAGGDCFELFAGGATEQRLARITRDRRADLFRVYDAEDGELAKGALEQVMAALEMYLMARHGELPDLPA